MFKRGKKLQEIDLKEGVDYYAIQGTAWVGIFRRGEALPENADYFEVQRNWEGKGERIGKKARRLMLHDDDVVYAQWKNEDGEWEHEVASVRALKALEIDILDAGKVQVYTVEWYRGDEWREPKLAEPYRLKKRDLWPFRF